MGYMININIILDKIADTPLKMYIVIILNIILLS